VFIHPAVRRARIGLPLTALLIAILAAHAGVGAQSKKDFAVVAHKYGYQVDGHAAEVHVQLDDLVRITFSTDDIPHSFTLEDETYRIMRRAEPGKPVMFEFRADKAGRFPFRCTLTADDRCKEMQGWLVVDGKKPPLQR
jgi:heme/copper-type cytochrome/quinol oxidase subunit 2